MVICTCSFTNKGKLIEENLAAGFPDNIFIAKEASQPLKDFVHWSFEHKLAVVFVGAVGIAVRTIAPFVNDKLTDSPVIVIDEQGKFVIPVLSGHVGGANRLAEEIAAKIGAVPVITTATDVENKFAIDVFAVNNGLKIENKDGIKLISKKILNDEKITVWISSHFSVCKENLPEQIELLSSSSLPQKADVCIFCDDKKSELPEGLLYLSFKKFCLGMGCKKGKTFDDLKVALESVLNPDQIERINSLSSIDLKEKELGLQMLAQFYDWKFLTYSSEQLEKTVYGGEGESSEQNFSESDFVKQITGVSNVCERAAVQTAGEKSSLVVRKTCVNGITIALAEQLPSIVTWSCK